MPYYLTIILVVISFLVIAVIVLRKFSILARIDVDNIEAEKQRLVKRKIINDKFKRQLNKFGKTLWKVLKPIIGLIGKLFLGLYNKLIDVKDNYAKTTVMSRPDSQSLSKLFAEARDFANKEDLVAAESKYIEIIGQDSSNAQAFQELGEVYFSKAEYQDAEQTFLHVIKLLGERDERKAELAKAYFYLGSTYRELNELIRAQENIGKALEIEPANPRYLDRMIDFSILDEDKESARQYWQKLKVVNPENNKLEDFKQRINEL
jgi:rhomboid protease GluP